MSAPPGHDAGVSMLSGGNAPINPVMGGGGYIDESASFLRSLMSGGADIPIMPVGGDLIKDSPSGPAQAEAAQVAAAAAAETAAESASFVSAGVSPADAAVLVAQGIQPVQLETVTKTQVEYYRFKYEKNPALENATISTLKNVVRDAYDQLEIEESKISSLPYVRLLANYVNDNSGRVLPVTIPSSTKSIILVPPIQGQLEAFDHLLNMLESFGYINKSLSEPNKIYINPNTVIIFSHPYFGGTEFVNELLFILFAQLQQENKGKVFILTQTTPPMSPPYSLEPAVIKFISPNPADKNLKFLAEPESVDVDGPSGAVSSSLPTYITITRGPVSTYEPHSKIAGELCKTLYSTIDIDELSGNQLIGPMNNSQMLMIFRIEPTTPYRPSCMPQIKNPNKFNVRYSDFIASGKTFDVDLGIIYSVRIPEKIDGTDPVYSDWLNGNFTESEVGYLYAVNISPQILAIIYPDVASRAKAVADFLYSTVKSKCFIDETLLTRTQCFNTRQLVNKIQQALLLHPEVLIAANRAAKDNSYDDIYGPAGISTELDIIDGNEKDLSRPIMFGVGDKAGFLYKTILVVNDSNENITMVKQLQFTLGDKGEDQALTDALGAFNERYKGRWTFKTRA